MDSAFVNLSQGYSLGEFNKTRLTNSMFIYYMTGTIDISIVEACISGFANHVNMVIIHGDNQIISFLRKLQGFF